MTSIFATATAAATAIANGFAPVFAKGCPPSTHILIIAHAPLASAFRQCVLHVYEEEQQQLQQQPQHQSLPGHSSAAAVPSLLPNPTSAKPALSSAPRYCAGIAALDVQPDLAPEETLAQAQSLLAELQSSNPAQPTLILTDIFGATPCNVAQKLADGSRTRLVAGINLPMLLRSVCYRKEPLDALVARALAGGGQGVMQVAAAAPQNQSRKIKTDDQNHHEHQQ